MSRQDIPLADVFAARPDRYHLLDKGVRAAGWEGGGLELLEVGCSRGDAAAYMAKQGHRVTGVDISQGQIEQAKERQPHAQTGGALAFLCADAADLPFEDGAFGGVYSEAAFSPLPDKAAAVREYCRVLRPGGRVLLNDFAIHVNADPLLREELEHIPCFAGVQTISCYREILESAGLRAISCKEEYGELIRLSMWICKSYGVKPNSIGAYLSGFYNAGHKPDCCINPQKRGEFFRQSRMTYCQLVFEKK